MNNEINTNMTNAWKESTQKIFWGVIVIAVAGIFNTVYDYLSYGVAILGMVAKMMPNGFGEDLGSFLTSFKVIGILGKLVVVAGYALYLLGLTQLATIQSNGEASFNILKVRKAVIILIGAFVASVVLGFIPFVGVVISLAVWVATLVSYYYMKNAFGVLMKSPAFSAVSQSGAQKLHVAAKANIRLMWLPLIALGALLLVGLIALSMTKSMSLGALQTIVVIVGIILGGIVIYAVIQMIIALVYPFIGWYKILNGGPGDGTQGDYVVDGQQMATIPTSQDFMRTLSEKWSQIAFAGMVLAMVGLLLPRLFALVNPLYLYDRTEMIYIVGIVLYLIGWGACYAGFHILDCQQLYRITASYVKTIKTSILIIIAVTVVRNGLELLLGMSISLFVYYALWFIEIAALTYAYFRMLLAFGALSKFPNMDDQMRSGFRNLKNGVVALLIIMALDLYCWVGNVFFDFFDSPWMNLLKLVAIIVALIFSVIGWLRITKGSTVPASEEAMAAIPTAQEQFRGLTGQVAPLFGKSKSFVIANKKIIGIGAGAVVVIGLLIWLVTSLFSGSSVTSKSDNTPSNLLNVEAPAWKEFVHPKTDGVKLYKSADSNSPRLQIAMEPCDGDACDTELIWSGEKKPRGWTANDWDTYVGDVFPVLADEGDYYKVYVSHEWLGAAEAFIKKSECEVVKPVKITQEILDAIGKEGYRRDYVIQEGALKNLCFSSYYGDYDELMFCMGQLCDNCIVLVNTKAVWLSPSDEDGPIEFSRSDNDPNEAYQLAFGKNNCWTSGENSSGLFDAQKLSEEQAESIYNAIRMDSTNVMQVLYYIPDVDKGNLKSFSISDVVMTAAD